MGNQVSRRYGIPALALLLVAAVALDAARRAIRPPEPRPRPALVAARAAPARPQGVEGAVEPATDITSRMMPAALPTTERLDPAARMAALRRIDEEGAGTYLAPMLSSGDSTLHRWADNRASRPLRVAVSRGTVPGFPEVFIANVGWAVSRWNGVGLPVLLEQTGDTAGADITVTWVERLDSNRTGRADVTWQRRGPITHVHVTLATHTPDGRAVLPAQMVALALHELGHALGLGHSPVAGDALYPQTSATELTPRDRRTATLLYSIPPGSLK